MIDGPFYNECINAFLGMDIRNYNQYWFNKTSYFNFDRISLVKNKIKLIVNLDYILT